MKVWVTEFEQCEPSQREFNEKQYVYTLGTKKNSCKSFQCNSSGKKIVCEFSTYESK